MSTLLSPFKFPGIGIGVGVGVGVLVLNGVGLGAAEAEGEGAGGVVGMGVGVGVSVGGIAWGPNLVQSITSFALNDQEYASSWARVEAMAALIVFHCC